MKKISSVITTVFILTAAFFLPCSSAFAGDNENAALGTNVSSYSYWDRQLPFKNLFPLKTGWFYSDPYISWWGTVEPVPLDENGYPTYLPAGRKIYTYVLIHRSQGDKDPQGNYKGYYPAGTYLLLYDGKAQIEFSGDPKNIKRVSEGRYEFDIPLPSGGFTMLITSMDNSDHIRNIRLIEKQYELDYLSDPYQPDFVAFLKQFRVLRFVWWMLRETRNYPARYDFAVAATQNSLTLGRGAKTTVESGILQAASATNVTLSSSANSTNYYYSHWGIRVGGQVRRIIDYNGSTKVVTLDRKWDTTPLAGDQYTVDPYTGQGLRVVTDASNPDNLVYQIRTITGYDPATKIVSVSPDWDPMPQAGDEFFLETGSVTASEIAQGATTNTITLGPSSSRIDDYYKGMIISTAVDWTNRYIIAYNGTTHVATLNTDWKTLPSAGNNYYSGSSYYIFKMMEKKWEDRIKKDYLDQRRDGRSVAVEILVDIANHIHASPWFCLPVEADDDYIRNFATYVRDNLDKDLKAYIEYGNETWNDGYPGSSHNAAMGAEIGVNSAQKYNAYRSVQMFKIWNEVFGEVPNGSHLRQDRKSSRLVRIMATQNANPGGVSIPRLDFDGSGIKAGYPNPIEPGHTAADYTDVLATGGYFGGPICGLDCATKTLDELLDKTELDVVGVLPIWINNAQTFKGTKATVTQDNTRVDISSELTDMRSVYYGGNEWVVQLVGLTGGDLGQDLFKISGIETNQGLTKTIVLESAPTSSATNVTWRMGYISRPEGTQAKLEANNKKVDLSLDGPNLEKIEPGWYIQLTGRTDGDWGSNNFFIESVDKINKAVYLRTAPTSSATGVRWTIQFAKELKGNLAQVTKDSLVVNLAPDMPDLVGFPNYYDMQLVGRTDGEYGTDIFRIASIDNKNKTITLRTAPTGSATGVTWRIGSSTRLHRMDNVTNAKARGLDTIIYEGASHFALSASDRTNTAHVAKMAELNREPRLKDIYLEALNTWKNMGVDANGKGAKLWCNFTDIGVSGQYGAFGSREYYNQPIETAPKWQAMVEFMQNNPAWWTDSPNSGFVYGDISGDGQVTAYDAALVAQASVNLISFTTDQTKAANVSGDNEVTGFDAALIAQRAVGMIDKFPVEA